MPVSPATERAAPQLAPRFRRDAAQQQQQQQQQHVIHQQSRLGIDAQTCRDAADR